jgi:predicted CXXCH cytochrome family protein
MTGRRRVLLAVAASALAAVSPVPAWAQVNNVAVTKHNLSVTGPGGIHSSNETEICVFCHTPHAGSPVVPLWNHDTSRTTYQMYQSTSFQAQSGGPYLPNGSSVLCLSCHDGTVAVAALRGRTQPTMTGTAAGGYLPTGASNLGANLRDDHPFSFPYANASLDPEIRAAPLAPATLEDGRLQCASCHEPHITSRDFLRTGWENGTLCLDCHSKPSWAAGSHATSVKIVAGDTTVARMACNSCHRVHAAPHPERLLARDSTEKACYRCHGTGSTIATDVQTEFNRAYRHRVFAYEAQHQPVTVQPPLEGSPITTKHVECTDCHDGHAANSTTPSGRIRNVMGVTIGGAAVRLTSSSPEYQLCLRCHAFGGETITGTGDDKFLHFGTTAPASGWIDGTTNVPKGFHPVISAGRGDATVFNNSLSGGMSSTSVMGCSDCHASQTTASDSGWVDARTTQVEGPHGSSNNYILRGAYSLAACLATLNASNCQPYASSNGSAFGLCFACHRIGMWTSSSYTYTRFKAGTSNLHQLHASFSGCPECHYDMHSNAHATTHTTFGNIPAGLTQYAQQSTHLINFPPSVSGIPNTTNPQWRYNSSTTNWECYLSCHGKQHNPYTYR